MILNLIILPWRKGHWVLLSAEAFSWSTINHMVSLVYTSFLSTYFCNYPFCGRWCCKTSICISCCRSRWFTYTKLSAFTSPPSTCCTGEQSFKLLLNRWIAVFVHQHFWYVRQIYKWIHYFFQGIFTIYDSVYEREALATGCLYYFNELAAWQVFVTCLLSISLVSKSK